MFSVNSHKGAYHVMFDMSLNEAVKKHIQDVDFLVIDKNVYEKYPIFSQSVDYERTFVLTAGEETKTLQNNQKTIKNDNNIQWV